MGDRKLVLSQATAAAVKAAGYDLPGIEIEEVDDLEPRPSNTPPHPVLNRAGRRAAAKLSRARRG